MKDKKTASGKYLVYLQKGDPSHDGHGQTEKILFESNYSVKDIDKAYLASVKLTGVRFDSHSKLPHKKDWDVYSVATNYDEPNISEEALEIFFSHGLTWEKLLEMDNNLDFSDCMEELPSEIETQKKHLEEHGAVSVHGSYDSLFIWFLKLSLPDLELISSPIVEDIPSILDGSGFGYGLFYG